MTYRSAENKIREIMAKSFLKEDVGQASHMEPADKTSDAERISAALKVLHDNGCPSAKASDRNDIVIAAGEANRAADVLDHALVKGIIAVKPHMVSAEAIPMPEPHVPEPIATPVGEESIVEGKTVFHVQNGKTTVKLGDNHERVWTHNGHDLYRNKEDDKDHMLLRRDNSVHSMFHGDTSDVKHMIKGVGLPALRKGLKEDITIDQGSVDENGVIHLKPRSVRNRTENQVKKVDEDINRIAREILDNRNKKPVDETYDVTNPDKKVPHENLVDQALDNAKPKISKLKKKVTKEEVEQVDELSTATLHKVANVARKKGRKDVLDSAIKANKRKKTQPDYKFAGEENTSEPVDLSTQQLDELSLSALTSYQKGATKPLTPMDKRVDKRRKGLTMAAKKITKAVFGESTTPLDMIKRVRALSEASGLRLKATIHSECGKHTAKIYKDHEWNEHTVKFHINGKHHEPADYHTSDYEDAHGTANLELKRMSKLNGALKESAEVPAK